MSPHPPKRLVEEFAKGNGVLWLGAGCSVASGLPTWEGLVDRMWNELLENSADFSGNWKGQLDMLEVAQLLKDTIGEHDYYDFLRTVIKRRRASASENRTLEAVAHVVNEFLATGITVVSTNYDQLLEKCLEKKHGIDARPIVLDDQIATLNLKEEFSIIKPNGDIDNPRSIVATLSDYCQFRVRKKLFVDKLAELFSRSTFLFVGYGLGDFTFNIILGELQARYDGINRKAYLITKDAVRAKKSVYKSLGIEVIGLDSYDDVPGFLRELARLKIDVAQDIAIQRRVRAGLETSSFLFIDDSPEWEQLTKSLLEKLKFQDVVCTSNAKQAVELLNERSFDFVITDYRMPDILGDQVVRIARSGKNRTAIIAVRSGYRHIEKDVLHAGADCFFNKEDVEFDKMLEELYLLKRVRDGCYEENDSPSVETA